MIKQHLIVTND